MDGVSVYCADFENELLASLNAFVRICIIPSNTYFLYRRDESGVISVMRFNKSIASLLLFISMYNLTALMITDGFD